MKKPIPHGLNITTGIIVIILLFGVRYGSIVVPQIRQTADKVARLNDLSNVHMKIGGCIPVDGNL